MRVSPAGETLQVYDKDATGAAFIGPNDFVADDAGGVFMSASGPWETAPIVGKILYRAPDGSLRTVADDLHYANGLALSPDGKTLYCSETYAYRIVAFDVGENGSLTNRREFARVNDIAGGAPPLAPDGLKTDAMGNLYIALYEGGKVLVADPAGKLLATIDPPAPKISNVGFGADASVLYHHRRARRYRRALAGRGLPDRQSDRSLKSALFRLICGSGSCRLADRVAPSSDDTRKANNGHRRCTRRGQGLGVRGTVRRRAECRRALPDDVDRPSHRPVRRDGRVAAGDERPDCGRAPA